ncbi:tetratricopeptide repeat protein [Roseomonas sp. CCTCC AB2023176]|uniref:tetratricopeptide repeat protein n=1 Tax=Roseomonas sp. CCTCC AB2023176 TaxID=3342640 RepID=UPI0035D66A00
MREDARGLPISTESDAAVARYREGVDLLLSAWTGTGDALEAACAADPDFALAHAARARAHAGAGEVAAAKARIAIASDLVARRGKERERSHVAVVAAAIEGRSAGALPAALDHLERWPRDAVIMSLPLGAFGLFAFSGMADHDRARVELCERHAAAYGEDWWFLTYRGWSHAENGDPVRGQGYAERALVLRRANANVAHVLAHAMFERGALREADTFIEDWLPGYDRAGPLHGHLSWHQALGALEEGDTARAIAIYEARVRPGRSAAAPVVAMSDGPSFLWRLDAYGHGASRKMWEEVAEAAARLFPGVGPSFIDVHLALVAAAAGDADGVLRRVEALDSLLATGALPAGRVVPAVCRAVRAFAEADYPGCVGELEPVMADVVRLGGSGAQRRMIEDMLLIALMRAGDTTRARALVDRRLHRRPSPWDAARRAELA